MAIEPGLNAFTSIEQPVTLAPPGQAKPVKDTATRGLSLFQVCAGKKRGGANTQQNGAPKRDYQDRKNPHKQSVFSSFEVRFLERKSASFCGVVTFLRTENIKQTV